MTSGGSRDSVRRSIADALAGRGIVAAFSAVSLALTSRVLGPSEFGVYTAVTAYAGLVLILTDLGSVSVVVREGLRSRDRRSTGRTYLHVRLVLTALGLVVGAAIVPVAFDRDTWTAAWVSLSILLFGAAPLVAPLGQLNGSMRVFRRASWIQGAVSCFAVVAVSVAVPDPTPIDFVIGGALAAALATVYALYGSRSWFSDLRVIDVRAVRSMLRAITVLGFGAALSAVYARVDGVLLLRLGSAEDAGHYAAAYRFLDQAALIPSAVVAPLVPVVIAELRDHGMVTREVLRALNRLAVGAGLGFAAFVIGGVFFAVPILLGPQYDESIQLAAVLVVFRSWVLVATFSYLMVVNSGREALYVAIAVAGCVVNVSLNIVVIPRHGAFGAAGVTVFTEVTTVLLYVWASRGVSGGERLRSLGAIFVGAAALGASALLLATQAVPIRAVYATLCVLVGAWSMLRAVRSANAALQSRIATIDVVPSEGR